MDTLSLKSRLIVMVLISAGLLGLPVSLLAAPVFDPLLQPVGYVPQPAMSKYTLSSGNETAYQTTYERDLWSGNVYAYPVDATATVHTVTERWNGAAEHIDAQDYDTGRYIVTMNGSSKVPFRWASLSLAQQAALGDATAGPAILDFVRGDRSNEGLSGLLFRPRASALGDIIHSRPYLIDGYLYVGANDGMLHVLDAATGDEEYAYIPSMFIPNLKDLTANPYTHTYFVDGSVVFGTATIGGTASKILVGGLAGGGKGLYALNITTPLPISESDAAGKILWEITPAATGFADLGYSYSMPSIVKVQVTDGTSVVSKDAVIVGNGYLNGADGVGNGHAVLYVIDAADGSLIREIDTGSGSTGSPNGLSTPTTVDAYWSDAKVDASDTDYHTAADGITDFAYAGDLDGNLWQFDLTDKEPANWTATNLYAAGVAITSAPIAAPHLHGGYMVNFATGRMLATADSTDTSTPYAAYGIWDDAPAGNTTLVTQTLEEKTWGTDTRVRIATINPPDWTSGGDLGWKTPLPAGERVVGDGAFTTNGRFYFTATNPTVDNGPLPDGENWLLELDYLTGGGATYPFLDLSGDQVLGDPDRIQFAGSPVAGAAGVPVAKHVGVGVLSQPVLVTLDVLNQTLFNINPDTAPPPPDDRGVSGGHFDFDIYHDFSYTGTPETICVKVKGGVCTEEVFGVCTEWKNPDTEAECKTYSGPGLASNNTHIHQYDDIFDVTGVNMRNASDPSMNLSNAIADTTTQFKVLVVNQALNPAAQISIGDSAYQSVYSVGTGASLALADLTTYTMSDLNSLVVKLPLNAFDSNDWGTGVVRPGLIPTQTGCVQDNNPGLDGERHNGALLVQIIKASTPQSALVLNVDGDPTRGYRIADEFMGDYVLAEYTMFWHYKTNDACYGDAAWEYDPGPDTVAMAETPKDPQDPAPGSDDPKEGSFTPTGNIVDVLVEEIDDSTTKTTTTFDDGSQLIRTETENDDGTRTIVTEYPDGTIRTEITAVSEVGEGGEESGASAQGRISWRQLFN